METKGQRIARNQHRRATQRAATLAEKTIKLELTLVLNTSTPDEPLCAQYLEALDNWFLRCLNNERVTCAHIDAAVLAPNAPEVHRGHTRDKQPRHSLK